MRRPNLSAITRNSTSPDLRGAVVEKAYDRWARFYDVLCAPIFRPAHRAVAAAANEVGGHVLEVGVGTGLLLPLYDRKLWVTGLDVSEEMLSRARRRLRSASLPHVAGLEMGDIHVVRHPDRSYDAIVMPFVLTLLASPEDALSNCRRMLRPGGEIIVVSHFRSETPILAGIERRLARRMGALGLRPDFPISRIEQWAAGYSEMETPHVTPVGPFGVYRLVRLRRKQLSTGAVI
jgi:phosphatidylethanolamine/phosphatidyl-N-methylethanolamine N-methyltransferase